MSKQNKIAAILTAILMFLAACAQVATIMQPSISSAISIPTTPTSNLVAPLNIGPSATIWPSSTPSKANREPTQTPTTPLPTPTPLSHPSRIVDTPSVTPTFAAYGITQTIGFSLAGRPIVSHRFGYGTHKIVIVGGLHGGYEWNTILLSYQMIDYFSEHAGEIPYNITLYIIPSANPDGQYITTQKEGRFLEADISPNSEPGRFNGNRVDLNRNWACNWSMTGYWGEQQVRTGEYPFSEPETKALSRFLVGQRSDVVVFFHSAASGIFMGGCPEPLAETVELAAVYSTASQYPLFESFNSYPITGEASDWLASQRIPSLTVELKNHTDIDWEQNIAAVQALIHHFSQE